MLAKSHIQPAPLNLHGNRILAEEGFEENLSSSTTNTQSVESSKMEVRVVGVYQEVFLSLLAGPSAPCAVSL